MFHSAIVAADAPPVTPAAFRQRMLVETGQRYTAFRKTLVPNHRRVLVAHSARLEGYKQIADGMVRVVGLKLN